MQVYRALAVNGSTGFRSLSHDSTSVAGHRQTLVRSCLHGILFQRRFPVTSQLLRGRYRRIGRLSLCWPLGRSATGRIIVEYHEHLPAEMIFFGVEIQEYIQLSAHSRKMSLLLREIADDKRTQISA